MENGVCSSSPPWQIDIRSTLDQAVLQAICKSPVIYAANGSQLFFGHIGTRPVVGREANAGQTPEVDIEAIDWAYNAFDPSAAPCPANFPNTGKST
jgi:hypothetical protein